MTSDNALLHLECGHVYHSDCLRKWLESSRTCPDCRQSVTKMNTVTRIFLNFTNESDTDYLIQQLTQKNVELNDMKINLARSSEEVERIKHENIRLTAEWHNLNSEKTLSKQVMKKLSLRLQSYDKENEKTTRTIGELTQENINLKQELHYKDSELSKTFKSFLLLGKRNTDLIDEKILLEKDKAELTERVDNFRQELVAVRKQLETQELENKTLQNRMKIQSELDAQMQKMHQINEDLYRNISFLTESKSKLETDYKELQLKYEAANKANEKFKTKISDLLEGTEKKHKAWKREYRLAKLKRSMDSDTEAYGKRLRSLDYNPIDNISNDESKTMNIKLKLKKVAVNNDWTII